MAEKKRFLWGIAAAALVFVVGVVACDNGTTPENEPPKSETTEGETEQETYQSAGLYVNDAETPVPEVSGLDEAFTWIRANAEDNGSYTIVLDEDTIVDGNRRTGVRAAFLMDSEALNWTTGVTITLIGLGREQTIQLETDKNGRIFYLRTGRLILGNNITLKGLVVPNGYPLVNVGNGTEFQMLDGSKITGTSCNLGAVNVEPSATFVMKGGEIYDNESGPGVRIPGGTFIMFGGKIHGNTYAAHGTVVYSALANTFAAGGGVCLNGGNSTFIMLGGEIYGNQVVYNSHSDHPDVGNGYGGGVALVNLSATDEVQTFIKTGGVIYGYDPDDPKSNKVIKDGIVQTNKGSAVANVLYSQNPTDENLYKTREASAFTTDNMNITQSGAIGGWLE